MRGNSTRMTPPHLPEFDLSDPGGVHQGAWPPQCVDDALPLWRQTHVAACGSVERCVDAVLEVLRHRDLRPALLLPAVEHCHGNAERRWDLRETTGSGMLGVRRPLLIGHDEVLNHTNTHTLSTHTRLVCKLTASLPVLRFFTWAESHDLPPPPPSPVKHKPTKQPRWELTCLHHSALNTEDITWIFSFCSHILKVGSDWSTCFLVIIDYSCSHQITNKLFMRPINVILNELNILI